MNKLNLEKCKKNKEEYDKKIKSLDYKIVETSVEMYNTKSKNIQPNQEENENSKFNQLKYKIQQYELEKENLTKELWKSLAEIKNEFSKIIDKKMREDQNKKGSYITAMFIVNKIVDVYFNADELLRLSYLFEEEKTEELTHTEIVEQNIIKPEPQKQIVNFDIEEQRIIDFENLLNHIIKVSRNYRTDVEKALSRFIINYKIIKNAQYLQNDFDNITNNYLDIYKSVIKKFEKDESIEALQVRINNEEQNIKNIENKLLTNNIAINEMQRQMQELTKIYFVGGYVRKLLSQVDVLQEDSNVKNQNINENVSQLSKKVEKDNGQEVFKKIKKLAYDKRMNHIIEISKWTKNIEEKLKFFHLEESDFQFVIYMIRQTESECNANFEQVANMIIRLCDANLQLEQIEENEKVKNKELQKEIDTTQILKDGIENIKKKYSKIPFIGRKVTSILSAKMLNE